MSLPVKRQHDDSAAGIPKSFDGKLGAAGEARLMAETTFAMDSRPAKVARHERESEKTEQAGYFHKRDGHGLEVTLGEPRGELKEPNELKPKLRGIIFEVKTAREGRDLRAAGDVRGSDMKVEKDVGRGELKDFTRESKEVVGRAVNGEEPWGNGHDVRESREGSSDAQKKKSPRDSEGKVRDTTKEQPEMKREDREKEDRKEKERKDEKRNDHKEDAQHHSLAMEKEHERDERDREKGERERERPRDRERSRDKEKEGGSRVEKREKREKERDRDTHRRERTEREDRDDAIREKSEKEDGRGGVGVEDNEVERKSGREVEDRKRGEKEGRDRREREKDRNDEFEGEKRKKRMREHERDRNALGSVDTEGVGGEKDKESIVNHGVQQRKRMLRPRGQSNPASRDSRSRFRPKESEGTQGRSEGSVLLYRIGEGMPELAKLRKDFEATERSSSANGLGPPVDIRIPAELATTSNRQIRGSQLWGTDIYTDDSDIVAVLMHTGYYTPTGSPPPHSILELRATIRIFDSQKTYTSTLRNSLRSRAWGGGSGCSFSVERCLIIKAGGASVELEQCLTRTPPVAPTLTPTASERTVTTRAASSSAYRQQRFVQEVTIQYNLCNEPWLKYSMSIVADRGLKKSQFTSARLKKGDVLYVETHSNRYELAYDGEQTTCNGATTAVPSFPQATAGPEKVKERWAFQDGRSQLTQDKGHGTQALNVEKAPGSLLSNGDTGSHHGHSTLHHNGEPHEHYRWSKCKRPLPLSSMRSKGVPLPSEFVEVLQDSLAWEEVHWSPTSVWVRGVQYILARAHFFSPQVEEMDE